MARSPSEATRFTSTGPYAATKPSNPTTFTNNAAIPPSSSSSGSQINFGSAPAGETPQQKIARLRAAAALAKQGNETTFDRSVRIGRKWADRAHRFTALGLVGFTVLATAVATAGITDMMLHNRRRRNEWLAEKKAESARELMLAKQALDNGRATEDQILLINRERAAAEAAEAKKNRPGIIKRTTGWMFGGLSQEEQKGGRLGAAAAASYTSGTTLDDVPPASSPLAEEGRRVLDAVGDKFKVHQQQQEAARESSINAGGPLDRRAQAIEQAVVNESRSWISWVTGR